MALQTALQFRQTTDPLQISRPRDTDAAGIHALIARCPPLDRNSLYCNLLQCSHFAGTCAIARLDGRVCGFVSGYRPPEEADVLFVWQVAVDPVARGRRLAVRLIDDILSRDTCTSVRYVHTTVTPSNTASRTMFGRLAESLGTTIEVRRHFDRHIHLAGQNETEELFVIGPFDH